MTKDDDQDEGAAQAAEAWRADAAPGITKLEREDSALWDPVIRSPEVEPPIEEPPVVPAELPVAKVVKMEVPPPPKAEQAMPAAKFAVPPARPDYYANYVPPPSISRSSGMSGWRIVSIGAIVISALVRLSMQSSSSTDYDYHPIDIPAYDPSLYNLPPVPPSYDPNLYNNYTPPTTPPAPQPMQADAERSVLLDEMIAATQNISTYGLVPDDQQPKVDVFLGDALDDACPRMRVSFAKVEKIKTIDDGEKAASAKEQLTAIRQRLDVVCPKKKPKK